ATARGVAGFTVLALDRHPAAIGVDVEVDVLGRGSLDDPLGHGVGDVRAVTGPERHNEGRDREQGEDRANPRQEHAGSMPPSALGGNGQSRTIDAAMMLLMIAIIGAGPSGLAAARNLQRAGLAWEGFELADDVGGLWNIDAPRS